MADDITVDELLQAYNEAEARSGSDGMTFKELYAASGIGHMRLRAMLAHGVAAGLVSVGKRPSTSISGQPIMIPVYKIKSKKSSQKKK